MPIRPVDDDWDPWALADDPLFEIESVATRRNPTSHRQEIVGYYGPPERGEDGWAVRPFYSLAEMNERMGIGVERSKVDPFDARLIPSAPIDVATPCSICVGEVKGVGVSVDQRTRKPRCRDCTERFDPLGARIASRVPRGRPRTRD